MNPPPEEVQKELDAYRGGWLDQMPYRASMAVMFQTFLFVTWTFWRATGLMLIGMALFKLGVFSAARSAAFYCCLGIIGLAVGVPIIVYGNMTIDDRKWDPVYLMFVGSEYNNWASVLVSLAYVGLVMLVCQTAACAWLTRPLSAVGQMAFTNYLMQSIICTTLFYGHGFGLFGYVDRVGQTGIVLVIWGFQLAASPLWLNYFHFGPAEWLWRALTYWKLPPLRRHPETLGLA